MMELWDLAPERSEEALTLAELMFQLTYEIVFKREKSTVRNTNIV